MRMNSPLCAGAGLVAAAAIAALCFAARPALLARAPSLSSAAARSLETEGVETLNMDMPRVTLETLGGPALAPEINDAPLPRPVIVPIGRGLQCAQYARLRSGLLLSGNAGSWWYLAAGRYKRERTPEPGAVMVMGGTRHGHVAVVVEIRSKREILIDHANWMNRGEIQMGALVRDVSPKNDWSQVRVWYPPINDLGNKAYPVFGFIMNEPFQAAAPATQRFAAL